MDAVPLSDVQLANLSMLLTIRDSIQKDPAAACCKFALQTDELHALAKLSPDGILAVVAHMGQESLFPPRDDLGALLKAPLALSGVMASARQVRRATTLEQ